MVVKKNMLYFELYKKNSNKYLPLYVVIIFFIAQNIMQFLPKLGRCVCIHEMIVMIF
jgi:hypothetical protein